MTDHVALNRAMLEGRVHPFSKPEALERQAELLLAVSAAPAPTSPADQPSLLPDPSALPATEPEAQRMADLEREAFTTPPSLASDFQIPGDGAVDAEAQATNDAIRNSLFAAQIPVGVAHTVLHAAEGIAQQLRGMSDADAASFAATRTEFVRAELQRKWGAETDSRVATVKTYLRGLADNAAKAGHQALQDILTYSPELLDDVGGIEALWNAAKHTKAG